MSIRHESITYRLQSGQIGGVQSAGDAAGHQTLHQEGNTEDVHASIAENLDLSRYWPGVVGSQSTGDGRTKLSTRLADTDPYVPLVSSSCYVAIAEYPRSKLTGESSSTLLLNATFVGNNVTATGVSNGHASSASGQNHVGELHCEGFLKERMTTEFVERKNVKPNGVFEKEGKDRETSLDA
jgi:hypothetical protein